MPQSATKSAKTPATETKQPGPQQSVVQTSDTPPRDIAVNEETQSSSHPAEIVRGQPDVQSDAGLTSPESPSRLGTAEPALQTPHQTELSRLDEATTLWRAASRKLRKEINPQIYNEWLRGLRALGFTDNGTLALDLQGPLHKRRVPKIHGKQVEQAVGSLVEFWYEGAPIPVPSPGDAERGPAAVAPSASEKAASDAAEARREDKCPVLPEAAWHGLAREYREIVGPCTEASHNYHLACFFSAVGCSLHRSVYIERAGRHYTNLYIVLVGPSGGARKSTSLRFGLELAERIGRHINVVWSVDSREGFIQHLDDLGKKHEQRGGVTAVLRLEELRSLIDKTRMEGLGNIVPMLTHAYDCPRSLEVRTRKNPISVAKPTLSMVAATTWDWLEGIKSPDLLGGLGNRTMWVAGEPGSAIPEPPQPNRERWDELVRQLRSCIKRWVGRQSTQFSFAPDAAVLWRTIYDQIYGHRGDDPLIATLCERLQNHCLKVALIYAALDGSTVIGLQHLRAAHAFTQFLYDCLWYVFRGFGMSPIGKLEAKIVEVVKNAGLNGIRQPHLKHRFQRVDMHTFNRALVDLCQTDGPVVRVSDGRKILLVATEFYGESLH